MTGRRKWVSLASAIAVALGAGAASASTAAAACSEPVVAGGTATITCPTGVDQTVTIPEGVISTTFIARGAYGGTNAFGLPSGGASGGITATYAAAGPYTLSIDVGTRGGLPSFGTVAGAGGVPGGGDGASGFFDQETGAFIAAGAGGGGRSAITRTDTATRLVTVAGGGGNGSSNQWGKGGSGGNPNGTDGGICHTPGPCTFSSGGHGATTTAGGTSSGGGSAGTADTGGAGKPGTGGGGGGAGCFGGGGAGDAPPPPELGGAGGGGGGGSTCVNPALTNLTYQSSAELDGSVLIRYSVAPNPAAPQITSAGPANFVVGRNGPAYTITGTGNPLPTISLDNPGSLPAGLSFSPGADGTATISGTPAGAAGIYHVTVRAANGAGTDATQDLSIIVTAGLTAPVFTSSGPGSFKQGLFGSLAVAASGSPVPTITRRTTLPAGLTLTAGQGGTATISGTPTGSTGTKTVTLRATNSEGTDDVNVSIVIAKSGAGVSGSTTASASVSTTGSFSVPNQATCSGSGPDCTVQTSLSGNVGAGAARTVKLGSSRYKLKRGKKGRVKSKLNRTGRARLRKGRRIKGKLRITVTRGRAKTTKTIVVTLKAR